ncbi:IclR family transcriptional regulator [Nitriliruptoraceae bacterium ZYF776]|nr:IclR family transcriptional regulator [Profundirhabdus halotolerans]
MSEAGLVQRTIWVLRAVAAHPEGIGLSDVARESGIPKATCYRVLQVLERERWLELDPASRRYRTSLGLLSVVGGLLDQSGGYAQTQMVVRELAKRTEEAAGFDVLLPPHVMVLSQIAGPHLIGQTLKPVPRTQPVWCTSSGKALLSALDPDRIAAEHGETWGPDEEARYGGLDGFHAELDTVRRRGFAVAYDELEEGAASVAAPVQVRGKVTYALWIGGPTYRLTHDRLDELGGTVREAAQHLSQLLSLSDQGGPWS